MAERRLAPSLIWLAMLVALSVAAAAVSGVVLYLQSRDLAQTRAEAVTGGIPSRGKIAIGRYGCGACHAIPGVWGANGQVGPDLASLVLRTEIAGSYPNDPEVLVRWLMDPQALRPGSGMPDQGVTEADARDIAAYLYAR